MEIEKEFEALNLENWQIDQDDPIVVEKSGQACIVAVINNRNGNKGVFRSLHRIRNVDVERFK